MKNFFSSRTSKVAAGVIAALVVGGASLGVASAATAHGRDGRGDKVPHASQTPKPTPRPTHTPHADALKLEELQDVTIAGLTSVGSTLIINPGIYSQTPDSTSYQWQRNGESISGATQNTYVVTADDAGKQIRVVETVVKAGYKTKTEGSNRLWIPAVG